MKLPTAPLALLAIVLAGPLAAQKLDPAGSGTLGAPPPVGAWDEPLRGLLGPPSTNPIESGVVIGLHDGNAVATGPVYGAVFTSTAVRFLPGPPEGAAPEDEQDGLALALASIERKGSVQVAQPFAPLIQSEPDNLVVYLRNQVIEVWQARPAGVKQSFIFFDTPQGTGDLVVRLQVETDYFVSEAGPDGLTYSDATGARVRIGGVVGRDSNGWRVEGELALLGDDLELSLPEAFVEQATYPILLDPPVTSVLRVPSTGSSDSSPDVSWDAETGRFCLVWKRRYATGTIANLAQVFLDDGTPVLPLAFLGWSFRDGPPPAVCSVNSQDTFVAVHAEQSSLGERLVVTGIRATDLRMTKRYEPAVGFESFDVGGDPHEASVDVLVVWDTSTGIRARRFDALAEVILPDASTIVVENGPTDAYRRPRISQSCGVTGTWLVAWEDFAPVGDLVRLAAVDRGGAVVADGGLPYNGLRRPSVDGDGQAFLVVALDDGDHQVAGFLVEPSLGGFTILPTTIVDSPSNTLAQPEVAYTPTFLGPAYTVSWRTATFPGSTALDYRTVSEDLLTFLPVTRAGPAIRGARIASKRTADFDAPVTDLFALAFDRNGGIDYQIATP